MFSVWCESGTWREDECIFEGTLSECLELIARDEEGELYIVEPDGFTVYR